MRDFFSAIINPIPILYMLIFIGLVFFGLKRKRSGTILIVFSGLWLLLMSTPFLPKIFVRYYESQYHQLSDSTIKNLPDSCDIIVLGSGLSDDMALSPNNQLSLVSLCRLIEGIRIHRINTGSRLILSGWDADLKLSNAEIYYRTAIQMGVNRTAIIIQSSPENTRAEAEEYVKNSGVHHTLILVTSAMHMPRAIMYFKKAGIIPIPAPTDFLLKSYSTKNYLEELPRSENFQMMESAFHEFFGTLWARIRWTG